jgi:multisubunit Na+/H+ antiporter MnhE subunit
MIKTVGYIILAISCLSFIMILIVPWLGFSKIQIAGITTGLIITGEILFYLSLFILGRSFYDKIKSKLKFWKTKRIDPDLCEEQTNSKNIDQE